MAISAARLAASGRRAGQMCSVEMCPWADVLLVDGVEGDLFQREGDLNETLVAHEGCPPTCLRQR